MACVNHSASCNKVASGDANAARNYSSTFYSASSIDTSTAFDIAAAWDGD
jgi:hypothetical protein